MTIEPVSVALKFGFLAVIYLFLLWISRSALRDLRRGTVGSALPEDATGLHPATPPASPRGSRSPRLVVERAPGHEPGMIYDLEEGAVLGRGRTPRSGWRTPSLRRVTRASSSRETSWSSRTWPRPTAPI